MSIGLKLTQPIHMSAGRGTRKQVFVVFVLKKWHLYNLSSSNRGIDEYAHWRYTGTSDGKVLMEAQHPGTGGVTNLVVHLVLPLHLLVEEGFDVLPAREHHGLLGRWRRGGERRPPGPDGGALALPGLRVRRVVLLVVQHPRAHPSRGHGGRI